MFSQQSTQTPQPEVLVDALIESPVWENRPEKITISREQSKGVFATIRDHDWIVGLLYAACDIACWVLLYGLVGYVRRDLFFASPFEFILVDGVTLAVILQALYIIGGYNRNTETRGLTYTTEHILAVVAAAAVSSLLIYSAAAYDAGMKPSRGVLLISFVLFLPISLFYRRF